MILYPAIDLYGGCAVRLYKGDYAQMTVYSRDPVAVARDFRRLGASHIHMVDLQGARDGTTPNMELVKKIAREVGLFTQIGGGIRSMDTVRTYLDGGVSRVILGTAAMEDRDFLARAVAAYGDRIAVGADIRDGFVAIKGWTEQSKVSCLDFCREMEALGVKTLICTDISKDGAMEGTNRPLYRTLTESFSMEIIASGGVSSLADVMALKAMRISGAIIGKAYYTGAVDLAQAVEAAI